MSITKLLRNYSKEIFQYYLLLLTVIKNFIFILLLITLTSNCFIVSLD